MLEQIAEKMRALKGVIVAVEKQFGKGSVMTLGDDEDPEPVATISTGSLALDLATGVGGYPRGRVVEIYGQESSGKTTLALHAIAQAQRAGGVAAFIDAEHALDVGYARSVGVATEKLLISQPDTGEQALDITEMLVRSGAIELIVMDSVAALTPKAELEGDMGDAHMGLQARLMSQALRKLTGAWYRAGTTLMFLNQLRQKIGVTFGSPETTTGGNALKFYASMRFDVRRSGQVKVGDEPVGGRTRVKVAKNKCEPTNCLRIGRSAIPFAGECRLCNTTGALSRAWNQPPTRFFVHCNSIAMLEASDHEARARARTWARTWARARASPLAVRARETIRTRLPAPQPLPHVLHERSAHL